LETNDHNIYDIIQKDKWNQRCNWTVQLLWFQGITTKRF